MLTSDKDRCTALHQAALEGFVDVAKLMIEKSEEMRADTTQVRSAFFPHSQQTREVEPLCVQCLVRRVVQYCFHVKYADIVF